ncbi:hypothetical protein NB231_06336 [Nitrococcus mobilis Nb-231]|uniref:Uncharacterized protein n=1 Tax=Nitrococcus mobilis Nb-231 TaxID=314278 RepID=A4BQY4_9GAMM|nr:hypothetical protein NB231_06336 [Nitrococcus mobilis Nb-231]
MSDLMNRCIHSARVLGKIPSEIHGGFRLARDVDHVSPDIRPSAVTGEEADPDFGFADVRDFLEGNADSNSLPSIKSLTDERFLRIFSCKGTAFEKGIPQLATIDPLFVEVVN